MSQSIRRCIRKFFVPGDTSPKEPRFQPKPTDVVVISGGAPIYPDQFAITYQGANEKKSCPNIGCWEEFDERGEIPGYWHVPQCRLWKYYPPTASNQPTIQE